MRTRFFLFTLMLFIIPIGMAAERNRKQAQSAPPEIASISPVQNALNVNKATNIVVTFNTDINPASLTNTTIKVSGSQSGLHTSSNITYNGATRTLTFDPDADFKIGEVVTVMLTTGIQTMASTALSNPYIWSFTIDVAGAAGNFSKSSETKNVRAADRLTTGDFDGDGDLDLAVTNPDTTTISILKNNGSGGFIKTSVVNVQDRPNAVSAGDFDGDGDLDLAVPNSPYLGLGAVSILKNNGKGSFALTQRLTIGYMPMSVFPGDFDGDGDLDLAAALNGSGGEGSSGVTILMNNGSGVFAQTSTVDVTGCEFPLTAGDWDNDGDLDLAVPSNCNFGLGILKNNGSGVFSVSAFVGAGNYPSHVAAGDLDGDGDLDLVVPNRNDASLNPSTVTILKNDGNGNFTQTSSPGVGGANPSSVTLGDFDHDGDLDVAVNDSPFGTVSILVNDGTGNFTNSAQPAAGAGPNWVITGDFDDDGDLDLAVTNSDSSVSILKKAQVQPPISPIVTSPQPAGSEFWVYIKVGDNANPVSNLFGVSFVLNYTHVNYIDVVTPTSNNVRAGQFLGNDVVFHQTVDEAAGKVRIGISRKKGQGGVNGAGTVARVKFVANTKIPSGANVKFTISDVTANDSTGALITLTPRQKKVTINYSDVTVWPGDTNNDGVVDQADILPIGLYWGRSGPARPSASVSWLGQICPPWTPLAATYADANGDSTVNEADVLPIGINWGNTHAISSPLVSAQQLEKVVEQTGPGIYPEATPSELASNQTFSLQIKVAEVTDLFGLAFELFYDHPDLLQILSIEPDTLLGSDVIFYSNIDASSGKVAVGISRKTGQGGSNGTGSVVRMKAKISSSATTGATIGFALQNVVANDAGSSFIDLSPRAASIIVKNVTAVDSENDGSIPAAYRLDQNYPNPFNAGTLIRYEIPKAGLVVVKVFNAAGQEVRTLVNAPQQPGYHQLHWDGLDAQGNAVPSGFYIYRLEAGAFMQSNKMLMLR